MYVLLIVFVTFTLGVVGFLDDYLKVVKKKPKGLIGRYKIVGQVFVGLVVGGVIYFFPHWIDPTLVPLNTSTTVPFFKNLELNVGWLYIPMVIFIITATSNAVNLTDGLDGLAIGKVAIVALTLAVISYISGNSVLSGYLTIPFLRGNGELVVFCAAMAGACSRLPLVQRVSGPGVHGRHGIARARRGDRCVVCADQEGTAAPDARRRVPRGNAVGDHPAAVFQVHETEVR